MQEMDAAFEAARAGQGGEDTVRRFRFGGRVVAIRIGGSGLAQHITEAFSHLALRDDRDVAPELTIDLWDESETGVPRPIRYFRDAFDRSWPFGRSVLASSAAGDVIGLQSHQAATMFDRSAKRIVGSVEAHNRLSLFELGKPLQPLLFAWHSDNDTIPVHAGLVARSGNGVLFGGGGGSGKSTTSLLCLKAGFDYLGDDYIGLPPANGGEYEAFSFYNSTWLEPGHIGRLSWLVPHAIRGTAEDDKLLVVLGHVEAARLAESATVRALVLPRVAGGPDTTWRRASPADAVFRLAPSSILQLPFIEPKSALDRMADLASRVPTYWLDLGTDLEQIPQRVDEILKQEPVA
jgi:hypothetical protein